jgi:hypothetical protein
LSTVARSAGRNARNYTPAAALDHRIAAVVSNNFFDSRERKDVDEPADAVVFLRRRNH